MSAASSTVSTSASLTAPTTTRDSDEARAVRAARRRATARFALTRLIQGIFVVWVAVTGLAEGAAPGAGRSGGW